jgi:hypothetical protein
MMLQRQARPTAAAKAPGSSRLAINRVGDRYEREADQAAELVMAGRRGIRPTLSPVSRSSVQREETAPKKPP